MATSSILPFILRLLTSDPVTNGGNSLLKPQCEKELPLLACRMAEMIFKNHFQQFQVTNREHMTNDLPPSC